MTPIHDFNSVKVQREGNNEDGPIIYVHEHVTNMTIS